MQQDTLVIACLAAEKAPLLLLEGSNYESSSCDFCAAPILVPRRGGRLIELRGATKACTSCVVAHLRVMTKTVILDLGDCDTGTLPTLSR
jgi:Zn-finger protein